MLRTSESFTECPMPKCRHCDDHAVARYKTPQGCVCFPDDREQDLCMQHIIKDGMIGDDVEMIIDYRENSK